MSARVITSGGEQHRVVGRQQAAARLSLAANGFLVVLKLAAGFASGSISVLAEGIQSTLDVLASAMILVSVGAAAAPPDRSHPYGHGKLENLASLGQMLLILGSAAYILAVARSRWQHPVMPRWGWGAAALVTAIGVNAVVSRRVRLVARETGSQALEAEAAHLRSDLLSCAGVLLGLAVAWLTGLVRLDPLIAAGMAVLVVISAVRLLRDTLRPLMDESIPVLEEEAIRAVLAADQRVLGYHRLRTRRAGSRRLIDLHLLLSDELSFRGAHALAEEVEGLIRAALPNVDVVVHPEPFAEEMRHQQEAHGVRGETS